MNDSRRFTPSAAAMVRRLRGALLGCGAALLAACGGGGGATMGSSATVTPQSCTGSCGSALVTLTDAAGDFDSYIVKVVSLQLTRADGTFVETLPVTTQVDFTQLVNLSEIISAAQVPAGTYVGAKMTLDYAGATIVVDNGTTGVTIAANNILNGVSSNGTANPTPVPLAPPNPTQVTLTLTLANDRPLVVTPGTVANLALDFNLAASNTVGPSATAPTTVTVNPVLTGSLVPDTTKQARIRGPLVSVDTTGSPNSYTVTVRPFDNDSGDGGTLTVDVAATTTYAINGTSYTGSAGLAQLATLVTSAPGTIVAATGTLDKTTRARAPPARRSTACRARCSRAAARRSPSPTAC